MPADTASFTSSSSEVEELGGTANGPLHQIKEWTSNRTQLSFVYSRSLGGLMHAGRAVITSLTNGILHLQGPESRLFIVIQGGTFSTEPQLFFSSNFLSSKYIEGVSVQLSNHDWLFLTAEAGPELIANSRSSGRESP